MRSLIKLAMCFAILAFMLTGCNATPKSTAEENVLQAQVAEAIQLMKEKDPGINRFFEDSYGYAVLPKVAKGGFWIGGAYGKGLVYEKGTMTGRLLRRASKINC